MEKAVGTVLYRNILREYGRVNQPKLIRDPAVKRTVLHMLESAIRGIERLEAVIQRLDAKTVEAYGSHLWQRSKSEGHTYPCCPRIRRSGGD
jgi:hypothetical protein